MFLFGAIQISLFVNEPGNLRIRSELSPQLFGAYSRGADKIRPPMVVRISFIVFPLIKRRSANQNNVFA